MKSKVKLRLGPVIAGRPVDQLSTITVTNNISLSSPTGSRSISLAGQQYAIDRFSQLIKQECLVIQDHSNRFYFPSSRSHYSQYPPQSLLSASLILDVCIDLWNMNQK